MPYPINKMSDRSKLMTMYLIIYLFSFCLFELGLFIGGKISNLNLLEMNVRYFFILILGGGSLIIVGIVLLCCGNMFALDPFNPFNPFNPFISNADNGSNIMILIILSWLWLYGIIYLTLKALDYCREHYKVN